MTLSINRYMIYKCGDHIHYDGYNAHIVKISDDHMEVEYNDYGDPAEAIVSIYSPLLSLPLL